MEPISISKSDLDRQREETKTEIKQQARQTFDLALKVVTNQEMSNLDVATLLINCRDMNVMNKNISVLRSQQLVEQYKEVYKSEMEKSAGTGIQPDDRLQNPTLAALDAALKYVRG